MAEVISNARNRVAYAQMSDEQREFAERLHSIMQSRVQRMHALQSVNNGRVSLAELSKCYRCVGSRQFCAPLENVSNFEVGAVEQEARGLKMRLVFEHPRLLLAVPMVSGTTDATPSAEGGGLLPNTLATNVLLCVAILCAVAYFQLAERPIEQLAGAFASVSRRLYKNP